MIAERVKSSHKRIQHGAQRRMTSREVRADARKYAANSCRLAIRQQD